MLKAIVISADKIKETLAGYTPAKSGDFHRESTRLADRKYRDILQKSQYKNVILLSGGSASGKTEYMSAYLEDKGDIIVDGTLPTLEGFEIKRRSALRLNKRVEVQAVLPDSLERAYIAFLERERKYKEKYFYRTHSQSRATLLGIAKKYLDVLITIIESSIEKDNSMRFKHFEFSGREELIDYLTKIQYSEEEIAKLVWHEED